MLTVKDAVNTRTVCFIKELGLTDIWDYKHQINNLCEYLKDVVLIKFNSEEHTIKFYYRDSILTYNTKFLAIHKESSDLFKNLPTESTT